MDQFLFVVKIAGIALVLYWSVLWVADYWLKNQKTAEEKLASERARSYPTQEQAIRHAWRQDSSTEEKRERILREAIDTRDSELKAAERSLGFWNSFVLIVGLYGFSMALLWFYLVKEIK